MADPPLSNGYSAIVNTQTNLAWSPDYSASGVYSPNGKSSVKRWEWILPARPSNGRSTPK